MKELRLPLDFSSTLYKIINSYYFRSNEKDVHPHAQRHEVHKFTQTKNSYFPRFLMLKVQEFTQTNGNIPRFLHPRILMQKVQKFTQTYGTILRFLHPRILMQKVQKFTQTYGTILRFLHPRILMQNVQKFTQTYGAILRILTSQCFWCKKSRNSRKHMTLC